MATEQQYASILVDHEHRLVRRIDLIVCPAVPTPSNTFDFTTFHRIEPLVKRGNR